MKYGTLAGLGLLTVVGFFPLTSGTLSAQAQRATAASKAWGVRTAWGDPDLQGKWEVADTATPMERPRNLADKAFLTDQEVAARIEAVRKQRAPADPDGADIAFPDIQKTAPAHENGIRGEEYNRFWVDAPERRIKPWNRASLIIDPPDGRMPPFTPEAIKRIEDREAARRNRGESDSWEDRNISERCIVNAFMRIGGGERQILQSPGFVSITVATGNINEPIIVPVDGRPRPSDSVRTWLGISRGRWEGSTLVVDTTHLSESTITNNGLNHSDNVRLIERFWLSADGKTLLSVQEFEDPDVLENRGARFVAWDRAPGQYIYPYECDPSFAANYQK
jgi:hypothetical protein